MSATHSLFPGRWWHTLPDGRVQCDLCPRDCQLHEGQRGACFVRQRVNNAMQLTTYGRSSGFCIDPIEKKPLNHFYPGSSILSFGTAGCNLACRFCQNWDISKSKDMDRLMDAASPQAIATAARRYGADAVAYTYNDPVVFAEYAIKMDAANVDLKAFTDSFYHKLCVAHLQPVLDTLAYIHHETDCWLEITTLLIPGQNDSPEEVNELVTWIARELGPDVPLHFSAFHPDWKMSDIPATPPATLIQARRIALDAGLHHVYTGNIHDPEGGTTFCPSCKAALIVRDWYEIRRYDLTPEGHCPHCQTAIAGRFGKVLGRAGKAFGPNRIPVRIAA